MYVRNAISGAALAALGVYVCATAVATLDLGDAVYWGPGYFPMLLGGLLAILGGVLVIQALFEEGPPLSAVNWRGVVLICGAPIVVALFVERLGLVPTLLATGAIAGLAQPDVGLVKALLTSLGILIVCLVVFVYGLGMNAALFGTWFGGY
ncbi:MAG: tripartite tricarboxylate transporter TctB family protein [Rhizobiales bacterium]|nr:tripartite tricarboxylate transporter TctB family protein [Hyphomicrobiales bacterium]OJU35759.1 MAG: hypothetical protein BGN94_18280 [Rhizobiales bacterium 68-8]